MRRLNAYHISLACLVLTLGSPQAYGSENALPRDLTEKKIASDHKSEEGKNDAAPESPVSWCHDGESNSGGPFMDTDCIKDRKRTVF